MTDAFTAPGRFWRGNLHGHSNRSDGMLSPDEVCRRYAAQGYDFTCVTDHFVGFFKYPITDTTGCRTENFTTILGAELHTGALENGELWHLLAVGLPPDFTPPHAPDFSAHPGTESADAIAQRARDAGAFVAIVHPQWFGLTKADAQSVEAAHAVEIYNHGSHVHVDRGDGVCMADLLLNAGRRVTTIATDDSHFWIDDAFGGWVMVKAEQSTPEALLAALKSGHFYASQGPELHRVAIEGDSVHVTCSPVDKIILQGAGAASTAQLGAGLTEGVIPLNQMARSPWLRVVVIDAQGRRAWSNPIWRD